MTIRAASASRRVKTPSSRLAARSVAGSPSSALQIAYEVFKRAANVDLTYVPFGGAGPAVNNLLGGHGTAASAGYPTIVPHLKSAALRPLLTAAAKRRSAFICPLPISRRFGAAVVSETPRSADGLGL